MEGVDYSTARPILDQLWAAGKRFVCRYLAYDGTNGYSKNPKVLHADERELLHAKGFGIIINWEQATGDMLKGYDRGHQHATEAKRQADALGVPGSVPIYFSCDVDTTSTSQRNAVGEYLRACADVLGIDRVGVYGEYEVIEALVPAKARWGWQTYAWSSGKTSSKAHFKQYRNGVQLAGGDMDLDVTLKDNIGAWWPGSAPGGTGGFTMLSACRRGDKGQAVGALQATLASFGFDIGKSGVDEDYGPSTAAALKQAITDPQRTGANLDPNFTGDVFDYWAFAALMRRVVAAGAQGRDGKDGKDGRDGKDGADAVLPEGAVLRIVQG